MAILTLSATLSRAADTPNFIVVFIDDMGYADIGPFGAEGYETPHLDRMAREGMKFTDFYVTQAVCSASRAGLLTGCYNVRVGIFGALGPKSRHGISDQEMTLAELVKQKGYATAVFGKWHLGHHPRFLPLRHGFDEYFGLPYSNDMWPYHPAVAHLPMSERLRRWPPLPLMEGEKIINPNVTHQDQNMLTTWYTERAVDFITRHKDRPFLIYLPHSMCHVPLHVSDKFRGKTKRGLFGDVVEELDWSVGRILDTLKQCGIAEHTLTIFTSDNGPWLSYGDHAGSAKPLREGKGTMFDGGCREPTLMHWPGKIPAGSVCREMAGTIDILPTIAFLIDAKLPDHKIDGKNIWPLMSGQPRAKSPHETYWFYWGSHLQAIRSGKWKLHFPHAYRTLGQRPGGKGGRPAKYETAKIGLSLFDLDNDIGETTNVADQYPEVVERLKLLAEEARADLGDSARRTAGSGRRDCGHLQPDDDAYVWTPEEGWHRIKARDWPRAGRRPKAKRAPSRK
ncbi:MAG TPA: arylsulfatase [Planctomycetaceae bacterium]|nr:arylsulfatase [Planctomycetaceae bacterium]